MDQERAVNKVLRDMKMQGLITFDEYGDIRDGEARFFINIAFVAGFDYKRKANHCEKRVIQEDRHHKLIQDYPSMDVARKRVGMSKSGMINAIKNELLTRKGHYFKYAEDEKGSDTDIDPGGEG